MQTLETALKILYVLVCLFLIMVVLLQQGRGGGMGGAFGGSSQTVFGSSGAGNFLTRLTSVSAFLFMLLSAVLAYLSSSASSTLDTVMEEIEERNRASLLEAATDSAEDDEGETTDEAPTEEPTGETPPGAGELLLPGAMGDLELDPAGGTGEAPDLGDLDALELELPGSLDELPTTELPPLEPDEAPAPTAAEEPAGDPTPTTPPE